MLLLVFYYFGLLTFETRVYEDKIGAGTELVKISTRADLLRQLKALDSSNPLSLSLRPTPLLSFLDEQ
jgi:hypothetical protein